MEVSPFFRVPARFPTKYTISHWTFPRPGLFLVDEKVDWCAVAVKGYRYIPGWIQWGSRAEGSVRVQQ
jgi:hypothetical protein